MAINKLKSDIRKLSSPRKAKDNTWFFKTGKGEYGYGDKFVGLNVPQMRLVAKKYDDLSLAEIKSLLYSKFHEERLIALFILVHRFQTSGQKQRDKIYNFYLSNAKQVNNWDLVDSSAPYIVGLTLQNKPKDILYKLAKSDNLWERRISILATFPFIRAGEFSNTFRISKILFSDKQDLIHKAVGWMLREAGKKDQRSLLEFLDRNYKQMPRTTLRYSIERLPEKLKKHYMKKSPTGALQRPGETVK